MSLAKQLFNKLDIQIENTNHFPILITETGESTLFIFQDTITSFQIGDQLGLFDENGIIDDDGNLGLILVGTGTWNAEQLNISAISSVDLSSLAGPIMPGSIDGNSLILKIWDISESIEYNANYNVLIGAGTFDGIFSVINNIELINQE